MKKLLIFTLLIVSFLFCGIPDEDLVSATARCDFNGVKDAVARGADINKRYTMKRYNMSTRKQENWYVTVLKYSRELSQINQGCSDIATYLELKYQEHLDSKNLAKGTPNEDFVAAGQKCDLDSVKDAVARGADINKKYLMERWNPILGRTEKYHSTVDSHIYRLIVPGKNCIEVYDYLQFAKNKQNKLLEEEKFWADKSSWVKKRLNELTGIDKDFFNYLVVIGGRQDTVVKETYIEKGADKNLVVDEYGGKVLMLFANEVHPEIASYLSLMGADSYGVILVKTHNYDEIEKKQKIFEDKHIKMTVKNVVRGGGQI